MTAPTPMPPVDRSGSLAAFRANARAALLEARTAEGHWQGQLSTSALSTATAVLALHEVSRRQRGGAVVEPDLAARLIDRGIHWLVATQRADGGWGDTVESRSNVSTSALCWAALAVAEPTPPVQRAVLAAERGLEQASRGLAPRQIARTLEARYGKDRTFSVPILTALAIAGRLGPDGWRVVPQLPFELAACPPQWFAALRLPVVSYALPALIAIGHARHAARPTRNPVARALRNAARARTLRKLESIQPSNGGFLEATPLTSFVVMSLASSGQVRSEVVRRGVDFIIASARDDGSWPIDTNLATWVTTLAVDALAGSGRLDEALDAGQRSRLSRWIAERQFREVHPYTQAAPGGWAWTDLPGGVPDADDTAGALLALRHLAGAEPGADARAAAARGVRWLLDLQNRDGGMPTFCRGWTGLPFDRSGADLTAHAIRAWLAWRAGFSDARQEEVRRARPSAAPQSARAGFDAVARLKPGFTDAVGERVPAVAGPGFSRAMSPPPTTSEIDRALASACDYLRGVQRRDGAFEPLWFGNEHTAGELNLTFGTARVLPALCDLAAHGLTAAGAMAERAAAWLIAAQAAGGGWGGDAAARVCSIEETALAVSALSQSALSRSAVPLGRPGAAPDAARRAAIARGLEWLRVETRDGGECKPSPIGLYFAKLWYSERLYPAIFTVGALEAAAGELPGERATEIR